MVANPRFPCRFWAASAFVLTVTTSASIGAMGKGHVEVTLPIAVADGTGFQRATDPGLPTLSRS